MKRRWIPVLMAGVVCGYVTLFSASIVAAERNPDLPSYPSAKETRVHFYPYELHPGDKLADGPEKPMEVKEQTLLIWVDRQPEAKFAHETAYILISPSGARSQKGGWWPVVNGHALRFFSDRNGVGIEPPLLLERSAKDSKEVLARQPGPRHIAVYAYPYTLHAGDMIADGPLDKAKTFHVEKESVLVWVDQLPEAFFAHPTAYILIAAKDTRIEKGEWWPVLNGSPLFRGQSKPVILSPLVLIRE